MKQPRLDPSRAIMLDDVLVRPDTNELRIDGDVVRLKPKVMQVLQQLIAGRGDVVTKSDILDRVWPNMAVTDSALTEAIHELRRALSDKAKDPRYIQTIPRRGYRIVARIGDAEISADPSAAKAARARIAVTYFTSLSPDAEDRYFCEGLCDELINSLGQNGELDVLARTSTLEAVSDTTDARDIAKKLGATHLVSGTLRKDQNRIRIIAHLIEGKSGTEVWSDVYDRELEDFIAVQHEIAVQIGTAVAPHLAPEHGGLPASYRPHPEAFREFSKGRYFWKQDNTNPDRAMPHYEHAMQIDSAFAAPYAGMVECYNTLAIFHLMPQVPAREASTRYAEQALYLDPQSPESLFAFGYTQFYMRWNWKAAETALLKCLSVNPNHALAHSFLALLYCPLGHREESRRHSDIAIRLDPFSTVTWLIDSMHHRYFRDFEGALDSAQQALELHPGNEVMQWGLADSLVRLGRQDEAMANVEKLHAMTAEFPLYRACAGILYTMLGRPEEAFRIERELQLSKDDDVQEPFICGLLAIYLDQTCRALDMLERAAREHDTLLWALACEPYFDPLHAEHRFAELLRTLDLGS